MFTPRDLDERRLETYPIPLLARTLQKKVVRKVGKRVFHTKPSYERALSYNGLVVFDDRNLDGGGWMHGQDYIRALLTLGFRRVERICEFCAGPGYIGFSLLANGFCEKLTLVDINPRAVAMARRTAAYNKIEHLVDIHLSDCLDSVPDSQHGAWDIVVSNPPQFIPQPHHDFSDIRAFDPDWNIHRRFYASVKPFMRPGGSIVMEEAALPMIRDTITNKVPDQECQIFVPDPDRPGEYRIDLGAARPLYGPRNAQGSTPEIFQEMIEAGGGRYEGWKPAINVVGLHDGFYYVISKW